MVYSIYAVQSLCGVTVVYSTSCNQMHFVTPGVIKRNIQYKRTDNNGVEHAHILGMTPARDVYIDLYRCNRGLFKVAYGI